MFLADFRCPRCQQRVAEIMAKMNGEAYSTSWDLLSSHSVPPPVGGVGERRRRWSKPSPIILDNLNLGRS